MNDEAKKESVRLHLDRFGKCITCRFWASSNRNKLADGDVSFDVQSAANLDVARCENTRSPQHGVDMDSDGHCQQWDSFDLPTALEVMLINKLPPLREGEDWYDNYLRGLRMEKLAQALRNEGLLELASRASLGYFDDPELALRAYLGYFDDFDPGVRRRSGKEDLVRELSSRGYRELAERVKSGEFDAPAGCP